MAVKQGELAEVKRLINEGADVNIKDNDEVSTWDNNMKIY